jgi:hypothetical protein
MDVAVLSGVSTVEWIESMERADTQRRMTAGHAYLVSIVPGMRSNMRSRVAASRIRCASCC